MDVRRLGPLAPARFRCAHAPRSSETVLAEIANLVAERQRLRTRGASALRLERNRLRIARAQWEFSYALIRHFRPDAEGEAAQQAA